MELDPKAFVREYFSLLEEYEVKRTENKRIVESIKCQTRVILEKRQIFNTYFDTNIQDRLQFYARINEAIDFAIKKADKQMMEVLGETIKQIKKQKLI